MTLVLPYPVSANAYWRALVPKGWTRPIIHVTRAAKAYKTEVGWIAKGAGFKEPMATSVELHVRFYPKDRRRFDIDNVIKITLDALNGIVYKDDSQVMRLVAEKLQPDPQPRLEVDVQDYKPQPAGLFS